MVTSPAQAPRQSGTSPTHGPTVNQESGSGKQPRLDSWKEIANYLRRSVRTVRRWEREEGLPVRRHYHGKQATIFAVSPEIDKWLSGRTVKPSASSVVQINRPGWRVVPGTGGQPSRPIMIAVLPLRNLSEEPGHDRFADGFTDELITEIGHCCPDRLRVIGLTSVMQYKQSPKNIEQIGQELGADYILEGGVRRHGQHVRLTARLIAADDQAHVWADSYEIQLPPVFSSQQTLARRVASALSAELKVTPSSSWRRPTNLPSVVAHNSYLEGRSHFLPTEGDSAKSIEHLNLAIERDPKFAPSYAELALAYFRRLFWDFPPVVTFKRIEEYASKALKLDPKLARAHSMLAAFHLFGAWSWSKLKG
jgi:adenylate cyclase